MSANFKDKANALLECSLCLSIFQEPKCLPCIHTFCQDCLQKYVDLNATSGMLPCPLCRHMFLVPYRGMGSLPSNFIIKNFIEQERKFDPESEGLNAEVKCDLCLDNNNVEGSPLASKFCPECSENLCQACAACHEKMRATKSHELVLLSEKVRDCVQLVRDHPRLCSKHGSEPMRLYCRKCNVYACVCCMATEHNKHKCEGVREAFTEYLNQFETYICKLREALTLGSSAFQELKTVEDPAIEEYLENEQKIRERCHELQKILDGFEAELLSEARRGIEFGRKLIDRVLAKEKQLIVLGLDTGPSVQQTICHISLEKPETVKSFDSTPAEIGAESAASVVNNVLYVVGIGIDNDELWKWSASLNEWTRCADMPSGRRRHSVTSVVNKIYVLGGWSDFDKSTVRSILCYDINSNNWTEEGCLLRAIDSSTCVTYKECIYMFGGVDKDGKSVSYVQLYATVAGNASFVSKPMPRAYSLMRAVLWGSKALLAGYEFCFIYDFESSTWQERNRFKTDVIHFGLTLCDNTLYIAGGGERGDGVWTCKDDVRSLLVNDLISDNKKAEWKHHATLPIPACISAYSNSALL